jgi:hypothetical protein
MKFRPASCSVKHLKKAYSEFVEAQPFLQFQTTYSGTSEQFGKCIKRSKL